jgi:hypothetical protein
MSTDFSQLGMLTHSISLDQAVEMTTRYRTNRPLILAPGYPTDILTLSETFNKEAIIALGNTPGAVGIRIYYGMDEQLLCHAILVAVDDQGADILPPAAATNKSQADGFGDLLEDSLRCPTLCPPPSALNGG